MQACVHKLNHLGMTYCPRKSTLADANKSRRCDVFESIYQNIYQSLRKSLPDSRRNNTWYKRLYILDATSISLFKEILKNGGGRTPSSGKRKGGIKVHSLIKADEDVPCFVRLTSGATHDVTFIKGLKLPAGSVLTFDKGYINYTQYELWTTQKVSWVTRLKQTASFTIIDQNKVGEKSKRMGIVKDQNVLLGYRQRPSDKQINARMITYVDKVKNRVFNFITNNKSLKPETIANIYQNRWQIELVFKRVKQNFPLEYFLGDNANAIKIQIWVALIADLLIKYLQTKLQRSWSFSNLASMIRIHLMSYFNLFKFLEKPEKALINYIESQPRGPTLFDSYKEYRGV